MALRIGGNLNFGSGGGGMALENPQAAYQMSYEDSLNAQKQNYGNILQGYQQTMANMQQRQHGINQNYDALNASVQQKLRGSNQANIQSIQDTYAHNLGASNQSLASRGLGNTTVVDSVDRGLGYDRDKAITGSRNAFANTKANYQTNIGLAGLNYKGNAANALAGQAGRQLDWMNSVNIGYPDAEQYNRLSQQRGQLGQGVRPFQPGGGGGMPPMGGGGGGPGGGGGGGIGQPFGPFDNGDNGQGGGAAGGDWGDPAWDNAGGGGGNSWGGSPEPPYDSRGQFDNYSQLGPLDYQNGNLGGTMNYAQNNPASPNRGPFSYGGLGGNGGVMGSTDWPPTAYNAPPMPTVRGSLPAYGGTAPRNFYPPAPRGFEQTNRWPFNR